MHINMIDNPTKVHNRDHQMALPNHNTMSQFASTLNKNSFIKKKKIKKSPTHYAPEVCFCFHIY